MLFTSQAEQFLRLQPWICAKVPLWSVFFTLKLCARLGDLLRFQRFGLNQ
jgi:hypothetical protein